MSWRASEISDGVARRLRFTFLVSVLVLVASYGAGVTAAAGDTWEGTWERTELPGKHLFLTEVGSTVSGHYDWNDGTGSLGGKVTGATLEAGFNETHYQGSATLTLAGKTFSGSYTGKNKDTGGPIEGAFDGKCIAGACLSNGAAPRAITPSSTPPALEATTLYEPPAPGADASYPTPKITKKTRDLEGTIGFVDNQKNPVEGPTETAVEAQAERAGILCALFIGNGSLTIQEEEATARAFGVANPSFGTCINAVARVLARNQEIQAKKAAAGRAQAAVRACRALVGGKGRAHSPLRLSCKATATGTTVDIRPRSSGQTLARAFRGRAPKLIIGRSKTGSKATGLLLSERWHAR